MKTNARHASSTSLSLLLIVAGLLFCVCASVIGGRVTPGGTEIGTFGAPR